MFQCCKNHFLFTTFVSNSFQRIKFNQSAMISFRIPIFCSRHQFVKKTNTCAEAFSIGIAIVTPAMRNFFIFVCCQARKLESFSWIQEIRMDWIIRTAIIYSRKPFMKVAQSSAFFVHSRNMHKNTKEM